MRLSLAFVVGLLLIGGVARVKRVSSTAVMPDFSIENLLPLQGGTLEWTSMGSAFEVSPLGDNPCLQQPVRVPPNKSTSCVVASGPKKGVWAYQITPPLAASTAVSAASASDDSGGVFFMRVGSCDNCAVRRKKGTRKAQLDSSAAGEGYPIFCQSNQASVKPTTINANSGTAVTWTATGYAGTTATISFGASPNGPCAAGSNLQNSSYPVCEVSGSAQTYTYTVTQLTGCGKASVNLTLQVK